jgi:hypothetical protein
VRHPRPASPLPITTRIVRLAAVLGLLLAGSISSTSPALAAPDAPTMEARILLGGHVRTGSWMAVSVHLVNNGPPVSGEIRLVGGAQGQTRVSRAVDLPTQSDKTEIIYAQAPSFGNQISVALVDGDTTIATAKPNFTSHDPGQLVVAVVAERPDAIVGSLHLLANQNGLAPAILSVSPDDLPDRVEAWGTLDRVIWQDIDASRLSTAQLVAMRGWLAGGGRLVIAGGTTGPAALSAFPDQVLPYRPEVTTDVPAANLSGLLGQLPKDATQLPALSGSLIGGRALATVGDRIVAAERPYGAGMVTLLGFDPAAAWIARTDTADVLWRRLLPARSSGTVASTDDSMLLNAVSQLPSLALPPITGLIALLGGYILLIGPINYLILRRLDKREWAWLTMPALIVVFAVGAYAFGAALRGSELIVNEVAIVRGAPSTTEGTAVAYLGVFSPSRGTFQVQVPGGALLSTPANGDFFSGNGSAVTQLDILQGDPSRVRDLEVGFGSLRTIRAESAVDVPLVQTDLRLENGRLKGTIQDIDVSTSSNIFGASLSDRVVGPTFFGDTGMSDAAARQFVRHSIVDQLTYDPNFGSTNTLSADGPVLLAWGSSNLVDVDIEGQTARHLGNTLYYLAAGLTVKGQTTFTNDLMRSAIVKSDSAFFSKDPFTISFGKGSATIAYRPTAFSGTLTPSELAIGLGFGGDQGLGGKPDPVEPLASIPPACTDQKAGACPGVFDGLPEIELFDIGKQDWVRLPHLRQGSRYAVAHPESFVDPTTGSVLVRYVNDASDSVGFSVDISISGNIE